MVLFPGCPVKVRLTQDPEQEYVGMFWCGPECAQTPFEYSTDMAPRRVSVELMFHSDCPRAIRIPSDAVSVLSIEEIEKHSTWLNQSFRNYRTWIESMSFRAWGESKRPGGNVFALFQANLKQYLLELFEATKDVSGLL